MQLRIFTSAEKATEEKREKAAFPISPARLSPSEQVGVGDLVSEAPYLIEISSSPDVPRPLPGTLQAEFTMLDPHLRVPLLPQPPSSHPPTFPNSTIYAATFNLPDRHGVFTLSLSYLRPQLGLSFLTDKHTISVTPPKHNEYDRFITGAAPYYVGAGSVTVAFGVFVVLWVLSGAPVEGREGKKQE